MSSASRSPTIVLRRFLASLTDRHHPVFTTTMGDRNNPIKFGPEWLRNLSRERSAGSTNNSQNAAASPSGGGAASGQPGASGGAATTAAAAAATNTASALPKVQLAKLRYGREEMLALYDRTSEAPQELKYIDILYQPRGKPPVALNNTFEEDMRDTMRTPPGGMASGERFGLGRGIGRGMNVCDARGRGSRQTFVRQLSTGRGTPSWHLGSPRMPGYSGGPDDEASSPRSWSSSNGGQATRSSGEPGEWNQNKTYRSKRPGTNTNWRSGGTREDEEWRASDNNRSRSIQDKWERDWGDRPTHRRTWVGGDSQSGDDNLPEWAVDNAEACGGTFDSSGAFHGYSNDDTNLPKTQDAPYALTRSHTHGSFARSKVLEEGSEEWWASEKAKKLSPKRFDASDIKFKKQNAVIPELGSGTTGTNSNNNNTETPSNKGSEKPDPSNATAENSESNTSSADDNFSKKSVRFAESKTFDAMMRSDINLEEASDERGNFQSVLISSNNSLRQKHQNIVSTASNNSNKHRKSGMLQLLHNSQDSQGSEPDVPCKQHQTPEDKIVDEIIDLALDDKDISNMASSNDLSNTPAQGLPPSISTASSVSQMTNAKLQQLRMSSPVHHGQGLTMPPNSSINSPGMGGSILQSASMQGNLLQGGVLQNPGSALQEAALHSAGLQAVGLQGALLQNAGLQSSGLQTSGMQGAGLQNPGLQPVGITNSALNASLGLPLCPSGNSMNRAMGIPIPGVPPPVLPTQALGTPGVGPTALQTGGQGIPGFPSSNNLPGMSGANVVSNSLFMGQNNNTTSLQSSNELQMNHGNQSMFPIHGLQRSGSQAAFNSSIYSNIMQQSQSPNPAASKGLADQWYYEDPKKNIQGPFSSKEMYNWYRAGFFSPSLMVRRACDAVMRPLGSYGPVVPFAQDHCFTQDHMMSSFTLASGFESRNPTAHDTMLNAQGLGLDVLNMSDTSSMDTLQFGSVGIIRNPPFGQQQMVESLWSQPTPSPDMLWMQQAMTARNESRVNNLPMFFWDQQPNAIASNSLLPEGLPKEMKTEDEILAQLRAQSQNVAVPPKMAFAPDQPPMPPAPASKHEDSFAPNVNLAPNLEDLHKLIQEDSLKDIPLPPEPKMGDLLQPVEKAKLDQPQPQAPAPPQLELTKQPTQKHPAPETKASKPTRESEKSIKNKDNNIMKSKLNKKAKEDKKEDTSEIKKEEEVKTEKRAEESSPSKGKKEEKANKKESEKEKKEWIKEGFTIVKSEKNVKDSKKKPEESKITEEAERKRREEEKMASEESKKKKQAEALKKQQVQDASLTQQQRQAAESVARKAPWSGVVQVPATNKDGLTLAEIQRLEREKKLEQMKEQQHMMQLIAQQQAAALAREQEMQAGLGWAKKKSNNMMSSQGQSLAEIQAEARKQAQAAAATQALDEPPSTPAANQAPWSNSPNGGGFWDTTPTPVAVAKVQQEPVKVHPVDARPKKKPQAMLPQKKEITPAAEFESWCTTVLTSWSAKVDVPTFVGFLKDIESPYEVKDYVKCYLGDSKDSNDFARQFLERRSKLLRVGMVTPSDDLSSPAIAVIPRTTSGSDYQEVKSKGKKTKKNKMMKVDAARLLGFSVTAAEDRINVGDIDTV